MRASWRADKPLGIDVIDRSSGGLVAKPPVPAPAYGYQVPYAEKIKRKAGIATIAVGLIVHAHQAEKILAEGRADLVALARRAASAPQAQPSTFGND